MAKFAEFLQKREEHLKDWKKYPDFFSKRKNIGTSKAILFGGKKRGAVILLYYFQSHKDDFLNDVEEIRYMDWQNGLNDFNQLKKKSDILNLMKENS